MDFKELLDVGTAPLHMPEVTVDPVQAVPGTPSWSQRLVRIYPKTEVIPGV